MKRRTIIHVLIAGLFLLSACEKNTDIFVPDPGQSNGPDTTWQNTITPTMPVSNLKTSLLLEPYVDSVEVSANVATMSTPFGVLLNFPPNFCVNSAGQTLTGKVQVELMLLKKKGDMIRMGKPTTSNDSLQVSAGELFIKIKKNGVPVLLAPNVKINIRYTDLPTNQQMKLFFGDDSNPQQFNWLPNLDLSNNIIAAGTQAYEIYTNHLGWLNVAYNFGLTSTNSVAVSASLDNNFTNANTIAFTVLKDYRSVGAMHGDLGIRKFISPKLPIGKAITVVVISKQVNDYYLGFENAVTTAQPGNGTQPVLVHPIKASLPDILYYLSTL